MLHRSAPAPDEEQGILYPQSLHRDSPAAPSDSAHPPRPQGALSMPAEPQGSATESVQAYSGSQPPVSHQMSPQPRSSLPILAERSSLAGQQGHLPAMASLPVEAHAQPHDSVLRSPVAAALHTARRDARQPQVTQSHPSTLRTDPSWQSLLAADSTMSTSTAARHQQQGDTTTAGASAEAGAAGSAPPDLAARHERSASGQEQGLAMAEQVISAYNLGMKLPSALEKNSPGRLLTSKEPSLTSKVLTLPPRLAERQECLHLGLIHAVHPVLWACIRLGVDLGKEDKMRSSSSAGCHAEAEAGLYEPQGWVSAAQPLVIDPEELTLGALIGEGGFGKALLSQPGICILPTFPCCRCSPGPVLPFPPYVLPLLHVLPQLHLLPCLPIIISAEQEPALRSEAGVLWCLEGT